MKYYELKEFQEQRNDYYKKTTAFFDKKIDIYSDARALRNKKVAYSSKK